MRIDTQAQRVIFSASDLKAAAECEFAWARAIDAKLGRVPRVVEPEDATLARAAQLGDLHEVKVLEAYRERFGTDAVHEVPKVSSAEASSLAAAVAETGNALRSDAKVLFQAAFSTDEFVGFADFLLREDDGSWRVQDSKLARTARVTALMQLAAYVDQLDGLGIPRSDWVDLILGDGTISTHEVDDLLPLFHVRRARLRALIADRRVESGGEGEALAWGDDRGDLEIVACGRCATCTEQVDAHRDLLMVARMRPVQRARLRAAGIETIDDLAEAVAAPAGMNVDTFESLRAQARLQLRADADDAPTFDVYHPGAIHTLPRPSRGDIFFDFEGDPLYTEPAGDGHAQWGIDYLFGWVDNEDQYTPLWAHTFADEKIALEQFLDFVDARRAAHPDMHIYHYAPYETSHLVAMAARYGVRESDVDRLLREGVFVDLYPLVLRTVRVGSRSYSIKKLEPLYMGEEVRTSDVQKGDDSIVQYVAARALAEAGERAEAESVLDDLADYNRYDCVSTRRLRNWLIEIAKQKGVSPAPPDETEDLVYEPSHRSVALLADAERDVEAGGDGEVHRVAAAAIDYYPREAKSFWVGHFQRLREPVSMWDQTRDVIRVDAGQSTLRRDWTVEEGRRVASREIEIRGEISPGTTLGAGAKPFALYPFPAPFDIEAPSRAVHVARAITVAEVLDDGYVITETAVGGQTWDEFPVALTPAAPPRVVSLQGAIDEWADAVHEAAPSFPADAAADILRRIPPRTRSGNGLPVVAGGAMGANGGAGIDRGAGIDGGAGIEGDAGIKGGVGGVDRIDAIVRGVLDLDRSYLAVQGPPGTGKTYTGSRVIARLVNEHGYRIGVVAQSHAIIETLLDRIVADGVPPGQVGKAPKDNDGDPKYTAIPKTGMASFLAERAGAGVVVGGTAWDFSNTARVERDGLDLLVIDEAGQFSLASTIAVAAGAKSLLLLGDPQQLPQVSQGAHPEPVNTSALGWVMDGDAVIRPGYGYFLDRSWRMHPAVATPVSRLSYAGQLASAPGTDQRSIAGIDPGLHVISLRHRRNATQSPEEAAEVVRIVRDLLGREFTEPDAAPRPLSEADIIVVAPYNAQKQLVIDALAAEGMTGVPVGTVDNFQGKEAAVSITTLAASSGRDAPRGPEFLLLQNRLNVAISRAQVAAYLIHSPALLDDLPRTPEGVARMSAFARLVGADQA
ncbi:TM0106 family RecB-like putative nuclease [Microbacterium profundi]|uniref:TM0106 family RecB-like putative nuclease n=1 Tax=Microbacterium profundi TaxID=450380 RepID=UPI001F47C030|nr:bifunctional RecB family nuclease/DEAD/DEAH box helicase [Microbacterium profundi]MCE7483396.1 TM0106 family RecB-like putative nuclease [Microbacterium profundi]